MWYEHEHVTKVSARLEEFQRSKVDFLVTAVCGGEAVAILRKGRRVENHHLKAPPHFVVLLQQVKRVALAESAHSRWS